MARWIRMLSGQEPPRGPRDSGGTRLARQVAVAQLKVIAEKVERGEANVSDLKQVAIDALAVAFASAKTSRDLTRTANVVRQWLADEKGEKGAGRFTSVNLILLDQSRVEEPRLDDGRSRPGSLEAHGIRLRLNGDHARD